ncbi:gene transfer agent family protein [Rhizobium sp. FKL33]|uniref:gene transfer agent family protein n=1 Tax=Rhizobium sp. FKL33 TaxID=2562307 RepID=UPI0010C00315|nr:gene transfer agent family protein [Rhizobium sp. FKL33]
MKHTAFFGDATYTFALTDTTTTELERLTGVGVGALYLRMVNSLFYVSDMTQIIRLGLIGGCVSPEKAHTLVETYVNDRPFAEIVPLALDILDARWNGSPAAPVQPLDNEAAA